MKPSPVESNVMEILRSTLEHMGFRLVRVKLSDGDPRTLQLMIEHLDGSNITVENCADVSYTASALLDVNEPVSGAYHLEVSSPGVDRPLTRPEDFERFAGYDIKLETAHPIDGRRRFKGTLSGIESGEITMKIDQDEWKIPLDAVQTAKLVITDALLKGHQKQQQQPQA